MFKSLIILLCGSFISLSVFSRNRPIQGSTTSDTAIYLLKNSGKLVKSLDSADYVMFIMPENTDDKGYLNQVFEYYPNGKTKFTGTTHGQHYSLTLEGTCTSFFANGHRKSVFNYEHGALVGDAVEYYPNGRVYALKKYVPGNNFINRRRLIECHDSTGAVLAEQGSGKWLVFNDTFSTMLQEGPVKDGLEDGEWTQIVDGQKLDFVYTKGVITKPVDYNLSGEIIPKPDLTASLNGNVIKFYEFLGRRTRYPAVDRENNITGEVFVTFIIEKDGTISNIRFIKSISKTIDDELVRVIKSSAPWIPAKTDGKPVRSKFTIPITFQLTDHNQGAIIIGKEF